MKYLLIGLLSFLISESVISQINGNGKMTTQTKPLPGLTSIDIQFNADIVLDYNQKEGITIICEENIINWIGMNFANGHLTLDQIKWIEPTKKVVITIGSPSLESIFQGTHSTTVMKNVSCSDLSIKGNVGRVIANGEINNLVINTTGVEIDLTKVNINNADVTIDDDSKVILGKVKSVKSNLNERSNLVFLNKPEDYESNLPINEKNQSELSSKNDTRYISFKIKNNSLKRNHFYVKGPKKDGSYFSYGFPMMPGASRKETWTIGTKIYKNGKKRRGNLLVTITAENEGEVVKLFQ